MDSIPSLAELRNEAQRLGLRLQDGDLMVVQGFATVALKAAAAMAQWDLPRPVKYARSTATRPTPTENPLNGWYVKTSIKGASTGLLSGKTVAIKDNVCVADIPMMIGSAIMDGFVPREDATIVEWLLDAGAEITGKAVCENLCASYGSYTAATGPVLNPRDKSRTAGGSSSGSAALVASGAVDLAIGCDQGGSIRIPAAFCGVAGLKPTWGLVPYTGIFSTDQTVDHAGPIASSAYDCALMLEVIAGPDGFDSRQNARLIAKPYRDLLVGGAKGLRIGVLQEGFGLDGAEADVDGLVRAAAHRFEKTGATVRAVSIPAHPLAQACWLTIASAGFAKWGGITFDLGAKSRSFADMAAYFQARKRARTSEFVPIVQAILINAPALARRGDGLHYARAQNVIQMVRAEYENAFKEVDVIVMPTVAARPPKVLSANQDFVSDLLAALQLPLNTNHFDATGHPALSVPCGELDGLPIGLQIVGRLGDDATVLKAGHAFEQMK